MSASRTLVLGGALSVLVGLITTLYPPAVPPTVWGYPFPAGVHVAIAIALVVCHLLKAHGFAVGLSRLAGGVTRWSMWIAALGLVIVAMCEGISATLVGVPMDSPEAVNLNNGYGVGSMTLAVPSLVGGAVIVRRHLLPGRGRWSVLLSGAFMIFVVTPALMMGRDIPAYLALTGWSVFFIWIGVALGRAQAAA
jgi:hypothetical protein